MYFDFLYNFFFSEKFLILRKPGRFVIVNVRMCSCESTNYSCPILMRLEFSGQIFRKKKSVRMSKISFKKICVRWKRSCTVRTDRQTDMIEANSRFPQFCERAKYKKKKLPILPTERIYMLYIILHNKQSVYW